MGVVRKTILSKVLNGFLFLFISSFCYSQNIKDLREIGNYVQFVFNTIDQHQSGISLNGYTRINIKFRYDGSLGWELRLFSHTSSIEYEGDPAENIDLTDLNIVPVIINTTDVSTTINNTYSLIEGPYDPLDLSQVLVSGSGGTIDADPPIEVELTITYDLGPMTNKAPGLYFVTLQFLLVEK